MSVFVLDKKKRPLMPTTPKRARKLLASGRARVHLLFPFCIRLVDCFTEQSVLQPLRLALDPGSKATGLAISRIKEVTDADGVVEPVMHIQFLMVLVHCGGAIKKSLHARSAMRRRRRGKNLRYRAPRFNNRTRAKGWLAPSLQHRVDTTEAWVARLRRLAPITCLAQELVRFDMQKMQTPEISGVEYQQGTLLGYEVREYLLEKWGRTCMYCDAIDVPLQIEHIDPQANGGGSRITNLGLACECCNQKKAAMDVRKFVKDPVRLAKILATAKAPMRDAAAVNSTRWALFKVLKKTGFPVETGTGGQTKWNRSRLGIIKTHALDAACVGVVHDVHGVAMPTLRVRCTGRGSRCKTKLNQYGFPRAYLTRGKTAYGFRTGDMVVANVPAGKKAGVHKGRVAIRMTGSFNIQSGVEGAVTAQGISHRYCRVLQRADGYGYVWQKTQVQQPKGNLMPDKPTPAVPKSKAATALRSAPVLTGLKANVSRSKI